MRVQPGVQNVSRWQQPKSQAFGFCFPCHWHVFRIGRSWRGRIHRAHVVRHARQTPASNCNFGIAHSETEAHQMQCDLSLSLHISPWVTLTGIAGHCCFGWYCQLFDYWGARRAEVSCTLVIQRLVCKIVFEFVSSILIFWILFTVLDLYLFRWLCRLFFLSLGVALLFRSLTVRIVNTPLRQAVVVLLLAGCLVICLALAVYESIDR